MRGVSRYHSVCAVDHVEQETGLRFVGLGVHDWNLHIKRFGEQVALTHPHHSCRVFCVHIAQSAHTVDRTVVGVVVDRLLKPKT